MATSQNGYTANDRSRIETKVVPGTERLLALRKDAPGELLREWAAWFDKNIETIDHDGQLDDWGYAERPIRGSAYTLSNHASGTAIDLNAPEHPLGVRNTFTRDQAEAIRRQLREWDGVIRWGGDYQNRPDEMHFEIVADEAACKRVLERVRGSWKGDPAPRTVHITAALRAKNPAMRQAALQRVVKYGSPQAKAAARAWLRAIEAGRKARARLKAQENK